MHSQIFSLDLPQKHFVHIFLWQHVKFNFLPLCTSLGKSAVVLKSFFKKNICQEPGCFLISSLMVSY